MPDLFTASGLRVERRHNRWNGISYISYMAWRSHVSMSFTDTKELLRFIAWPPKTPTGDALREWLNSPTTGAADSSRGGDVMASMYDADNDAIFGKNLNVYSPMTTSNNAPGSKPPTAIGPEWQPCVKLPITVHVREQQPGETHSSTREGITPLRSDDLIMRGVQGEEYPIGRELFNQTYRMGEALATPPTEPVAVMEILDLSGEIEDAGLGQIDLVRAALERWGK